MDEGHVLMGGTIRLERDAGARMPTWRGLGYVDSDTGAAHFHDAPRPVVFDFDGVLADTEPLHARALTRYLRRRSIELPDHALDALIGFDNEAIWRWVRHEYGNLGDAGQATEEYLNLLVEQFRSNLHPLPGAVELVTALRQAGHSLAIASSSGRIVVTIGLDRLGIRSRFQTLVTREDVGRAKPDPEPYRRAAARLGVDPSVCTAVEDSVPGATAARAAGLFVVGLDVAGSGALDHLVDLRVTGLGQLLHGDNWSRAFAPGSQRIDGT